MMRVSSNWKDYELLDATNGERLERWGDIILIRPDPQVIWQTPEKHLLWNKAHARYHRSKTGGGSWEVYKKIPDVWSIQYKNLTFHLKPMGFKHTGLFPEQAVNWDFVGDMIEKSDKPLKILNLFAYTGGATLSAAAKGAEVTHVDSSKGMVLWAKDNMESSNLKHAKIRWLVDDCVKFVKRETRRGNLYDGIIMDPPSYGRGPDGEVWKFEEQIYELVSLCQELMSENARFFLVNSYTTGVSPSVTAYVLEETVGKKHKGTVFADEIGLPVSNTNLVLPCGSTAVWQSD